MISNFTHAAKQALLGSPCVKELSPLMPSLEFFLVPYPLTQKEISLFTAWTHDLEEEGIFNALYLQSKAAKPWPEMLFNIYFHLSNS